MATNRKLLKMELLRSLWKFKPTNITTMIPSELGRDFSWMDKLIRKGWGEEL